MATFWQILLQKQKQKLHIFWRNVNNVAVAMTELQM